MATKSNTETQVRAVKLDYSETYRDNDTLGDTLNSQIQSLQKIHFRVNKEKDDEIEAIKRDADKIQNLKDVVNQRDTTTEISNIFSKAKDAEEYHEFTSVETSRLNRRLQKVREKFSAKNHFNVILPKWNPLSDITDRKQYTSMLAPVQKQLIPQSADGNKEKQSSKAYMQATSSSRHRVVRPRSVPVGAMESSSPYLNGKARAQSATRSRRELEELSRIELSLIEPKTYTPSEHRQSIILDLKDHQKELQKKVSTFVFELDRFNRRNRRNHLAKYLDT